MSSIVHHPSFRLVHINGHVLCHQLVDDPRAGTRQITNQLLFTTGNGHGSNSSPAHVIHVDTLHRAVLKQLLVILV